MDIKIEQMTTHTVFSLFTEMMKDKCKGTALELAFQLQLIDPEMSKVLKQVRFINNYPGPIIIKAKSEISDDLLHRIMSYPKDHSDFYIAVIHEVIVFDKLHYVIHDGEDSGLCFINSDHHKCYMSLFQQEAETIFNLFDGFLRKLDAFKQIVKYLGSGKPPKDV